MILPSLILLVSGAGLANALYFTFAYYGRVRGARWIPEALCAREGSSCVTVLQTPYARVFGVPNSLLGILYYLMLIAWSALQWSPAMDIYFHVTYFVLSLLHILILASAATVVLGFYLIYSLNYKLHTHCPLCYAGHAINATLLVLLILTGFGK